MSYSGQSVRDLTSAGWEITETVHEGGTSADWHVHEVGHFCLVVAGSLVDEGSDARRDCPPGTLLFFPPGVAHRDRFLEEGARCLNLRPPAGRRGDPRGIAVCEHRAAWLAGRVYDRIRLDLRPDISFRELDAVLDPAAGGELSRDPDWLARAHALVEQEWADDARLGTIAERVGVSRYHLARRFRARFGCSVGEYVHRLRVTRARHLLLATDASLSAIAFATGFADQSHFTRVFGRLVGLSPARYRDAA